MAAIDKTYTNNFNEYQEFLNWAKTTTFTCPNGTKIYVYNYVYDFWTKEDFDEAPRPIMCSSFSLDYFLIKYCPFKFVQDRMLEVCGEEYYNSVKNGTSEYDKFKYPEIGTKFKIVRNSLFNHKNYLYKFRHHTNKFIFSIELDDVTLWYNKELKRYLMTYELGEYGASALRKAKTIKALIRVLRKLKLPKNSIVTAHGRYVGEELVIYVK